MRKSAPVAILISGILVFGGFFIATPTLAHDIEDFERSESYDDRPRVKVGAGKYDKDISVVLPPLVIRPQRSTDNLFKGSGKDSDREDSDHKLERRDGEMLLDSGFIVSNPQGKDRLIKLNMGELVDLQKNRPIDISNLELTRRPPTEAVFQLLQVGLISMGVGALIIGAVVLFRAVRRK